MVVNLKEKIKNDLRDNLDKKSIRKLLRVIGSWPLLPFYGTMFSSASDKYLNILSIKNIKRAYLGSKTAYGSLFVPYELFHGLGLQPFLPEVMAGFTAGMGISDKTLKKASSSWYSQDLCTFHRSASGAVDLDLFPRPAYIMCSNIACDAAQKSFYLYAKKFNITDDFYLFDVPYGRDRESLSYLASQLRQTYYKLARKDSDSGGIEALKDSIDLSNEFRSLALKVNDIRKELTEYPPSFNGLNFILPFFSLSGSKEGVFMYRKIYQELLEYKKKRPAKKIKKILWLHLKPYYKNDIFDILHRYGLKVVFEEINHIHWKEMDREKPFESLAEKMTAHFLNGPASNRLEVISGLIRDYRIDGVILFAHWGCRQSNGSIRLIKDEVKKHGVPILVLDGDCVDIRNSSVGQTKTRVEGFAEIVSER
jgi:benzoyl-CoA reductase/2-hydroxyglutaryl-CoA dehydratase subunit BcrC/BadD/HgdB